MPDGVSVVDENGDEIGEKTAKSSQLVFFVCSDGFVLNGPGQAVCGSDGEFDVSGDSLPVCDGE